MGHDSDIEREIRHQISRMENEDPGNVTVNSVRAQVEARLGLESGFLKSGSWKARSKEIIKDEFDRQEAGAGLEEADAESTSRTQQLPESVGMKAKKKRKSTAESTTSKRQKKTAAGSAQSASDSDVADSVNTMSGRQSEQHEQERLLNDSELSDVIDDEPDKAKKRTTKTAPKATGKRFKREAKAEKQSAGPPLSAHQLEMRTLQSQLLKCGIRRVWGNELKKFDSEKAKISHLKGMLRDVGMEGRFSEDKARKIKEEREFKADLAEIKQGNEKWGRSDGEDEGEDKEGAQGRPRRRIARGLAQLDVFGDDEESE